ncbi:helix-turn-helix domain-containing protein [Lactobacillus crispatus]|uniref:helix-turn-helix domain-containing protein n=1 Tax=Lactobacillus crispatus TaxID=47770 RepID=UPI0018A9C88C|nr:helix-turn-helix transcriptional regulator [Lactobacillus crispatus]
MRLGQKIAALRKKNNFSQETLAEKMNISRQAVSKWESEQSIPDIEKIVALSELFGVTTDYLLKSGEPSFELKTEDINKAEILPSLADQEIQKYLATSKKNSKLRALAAGLILFCPAIFCFANAIAIVMDIGNLTIQLIGLALIIVSIATAFGLLVYSWLNMREFNYLKKQKFNLSETKIKLSSIIKSFRQISTKYIVLASVLSILSIMPPIITSENHSDGLGTAIAWGITWLLLTTAVYFFSSYLFQQSSFFILTKQKKHLPTQLRRLYVYGSWLYALTIIGIYYILSCFFPYSSVSTNFFYLGTFIYILFTYFFIKEKAE